MLNSKVLKPSSVEPAKQWPRGGSPCLQVPGDINDVRPKFFLPRKDGDKSYLVPANLGIPGNQVEPDYQAVLELNKVQ